MATPAATCPNCQQNWHLVPGSGLAHPGQVENGLWKWAGPSRSRTVRTDGTETVYSWTCLCGQTVEQREPRVELVECEHDAGAAGVCSKRQLHRLPPHDLYVNKRYGASCPCCGHQGTHWVRADREGVLPPCLKVEVKA